MSRNIRLGAFVIVGTLIFIGILYFLAQQRNLFGSTVNVKAYFHNVSGLQSGNNVQFSGINVGTVRSLDIEEGARVKVTMAISKEVAKYIRKDSKASIGSEGLMGNRIIVISSGSSDMPQIAENDEIKGEEPVAMEDIMNTFVETGANAKKITADLSEIMDKVKHGEGVLGMMVADTNFQDRLVNAFYSLEQSGKNLSQVSEDFSAISAKTRRGEGTLGKLLVDEEISGNLNVALDSLKSAGSKSAEATDNLVLFTEKLNNSRGPLGRLLTDTTMADTMDETLGKANESAEDLEVLVKRVRNSGLMNFLFGTRRND
ncbi:MlaD family protein [Cytophagaceae bacterium ABcell3]|nr:MlaD family protein [Cytophagaceae bacterium ABcell3]